MMSKLQHKLDDKTILKMISALRVAIMCRAGQSEREDALAEVAVAIKMHRSPDDSND